MALTPDDIERRHFTTSPNGYSREEVDAFLVETAASFRYAMQNLLPGVTPWAAERPSWARSDPAEVANEVAKDVAQILDAASCAADSMLAEAENDAARIRASADHHAAQLREQAERDRERVKRLLLRSEEQAASIVAQAEEQAQQQRVTAERDAVRRQRDTLARARRRAEDLTVAERQLVERLTELRSDIDALLRGETSRTTSAEALDASAPALDPSDPDGQRHPTPTPTPAPAPAPADDTRRPGHSPDGSPDDRTSRLVQAAVHRAASAASGTAPPPRPGDDRTISPSPAASTF